MAEQLKEKRIGFFTFVYKENGEGEKELVKIRYISRNNEFNVSGSVKLEEVVAPDSDGQINKLEEIITFLQGLPEGSNLKQIIEGIDTSNLTEEERQVLSDLAEAETVTEEEISDDWEQQMAAAMAGAGGGSNG